MNGVNVSTVEALVAMLGVTISILAVVVGTVVRATRAFTKVEVAASSANTQLAEYVKEDRVSATAYQMAQEARYQALSLRLSAVEIEQARRDSRDGANRPA